ncbi:hypothetical protein chiPu_0015480 [Chiloscyllium punctatum]|uniref:Proteasome beta subunit C-terminal domain-containing protein n=1 Tax=Chiloscyllium punctatum TaxID=137246 RepID=A0A401T2X2_CHIPU|nr:hypothetical protein [Chiloscyllium punctatum]
MLKCERFLNSPVGGFSFENCRRNAALESELQQMGYKPPKAKKTGTTITGIIFKDGVILGADTRATDDMVVADKNCIKIHHIAPNIYFLPQSKDVQEEAGKQLVREAITAGIFSDLGSGSNVDLCIITENKTEFLRAFDCPNKKGQREGVYRYKKGTTTVLKETVTPLAVELVEEVVQRMDTE